VFSETKVFLKLGGTSDEFGAMQAGELTRNNRRRTINKPDELNSSAEFQGDEGDNSLVED